MTQRDPLPDDVVSKALTGNVHPRYLNLERSWDYAARDLIRALAGEVIRLRTAFGEITKDAKEPMP